MNIRNWLGYKLLEKYTRGKSFYPLNLLTSPALKAINYALKNLLPKPDKNLEPTW